MFFVFSKLLTIFLFPLPLAILFGIFLGIRYGRGRFRLILIMPWLVLWAFSTYPVTEALIQPLEDFVPPRQIQEIEKADAIVVLGGMINNLTRIPNTVELTTAADRLTEGYFLYKNKKAPRILFTGGSGILFHEGEAEADQAKRFYRSLGVPENDIVLEGESRNTRENAIYSGILLREMGAKKIILVTSAFHMRRSMTEFEREDIEIIPFPTDYRTLNSTVSSWEQLTPSVGALDTSTAAIKEWVGIFVYSLKDIF
ncbi:YdcF family protein [Leptospira sp. GIMC2001]|uniref:YdcF family protein n=1 Tax=Leptospira sp. GIMC2001 TaxID=1513297 RepID=UPI00234BA387|nr:YdcF family protein [Leptospira sp. GIMC2001]WCL49153.1 YdcF family protein [Leptospira sp. GIMC2001]